MTTDTPATLRARAERLIEHYPGEHAAHPTYPHRHDIRRALLAQAAAMESSTSGQPAQGGGAR